MSHPQRRWDDRHWAQRYVPWAVAVLALGMAAWALLGAETATDKRLERIENTNEASNRTTAYRLCSRNATDRAFAHSRVGREDAKSLERIDGLPILDCEPNLQGFGAQPLAPAEQREFVKRWERGQLTREELGICPSSVFGTPGAATDC